MYATTSLVNSFFVLVAWLLVVNTIVGVVEGHGRLVAPLPRGARNGNPEYIENEPVPSDTSKFVCRNDAAGTPLTTLTAGQQTVVKWQLTALHVGDCFLYLTYDAALPDNQKKWFKIAQWYDCKAYNGQNVTATIPGYLPSCTNCIMRWEWYALHLYPGTVEYYTQCVDVRINGVAGGSLPTPQVSIPGHLPAASATNYRDPYTSGTPQFLTGPQIATIGGSPVPSSAVAPPSSSSQTRSSTQQPSRTQTPSSSTVAQPSSSPSLPDPSSSVPDPSSSIPVPSSSIPVPSTASTSTVTARATGSDSLEGASSTCIDRCKDACSPAPVASCRCYGDDVNVMCNGSSSVRIGSLLWVIAASLLFFCKLL